MLFFILLVAPEPSAKISTPAAREKDIYKLIFVHFLSPNLQKLHGKTTSRQKPTYDRKRNFIRTDLAVDTEGR